MRIVEGTIFDFLGGYPETELRHPVTKMEPLQNPECDNLLKVCPIVVNPPERTNYLFILFLSVLANNVAS